MPVSVPDALYDKIVEALPYGEERDALIALTTLSNAEPQEKSVTITIPERAASHFAYALRLGGTTAKMCSRDPHSVDALYEAGATVAALIPEAFSVFLHQSDVERMMDMLVYQGGVAEAKSTGWQRWNVTIKREGKGDFTPSFSSRDADGFSQERVAEIAAELNVFADRCRITPVEKSSEKVADEDGLGYDR